eukprot:2108602-Rhodomonas_salina.2
MDVTGKTSTAGASDQARCHVEELSHRRICPMIGARWTGESFVGRLYLRDGFLEAFKFHVDQLCIPFHRASGERMSEGPGVVHVINRERQRTFPGRWSQIFLHEMCIQLSKCMACRLQYSRRVVKIGELKRKVDIQLALCAFAVHHTSDGRPDVETLIELTARVSLACVAWLLGRACFLNSGSSDICAMRRAGPSRYSGRHAAVRPFFSQAFSRARCVVPHAGLPNTKHTLALSQPGNSGDSAGTLLLNLFEGLPLNRYY